MSRFYGIIIRMFYGDHAPPHFHAVYQGEQIKVNINGTAYYHDLGKFIADFENNFPHIRIVNLTIEPASAGEPGNEKLSFRMDIVALVKPNS